MPPSRALSILSSTPAGEQLLSDYSVHELSGCDEGSNKVIDANLTTRIDLLESEIQK